MAYEIVADQTRGKHNEELIATHTQDNSRESPMIIDCGLDLSRELCVQIGLEVHKFMLFGLLLTIMDIF